jgi:hypothetical protein
MAQTVRTVAASISEPLRPERREDFRCCQTVSLVATETVSILVVAGVLVPLVQTVALAATVKHQRSPAQRMEVVVVVVAVGRLGELVVAALVARLVLPLLQEHPTRAAAAAARSQRLRQLALVVLV